MKIKWPTALRKLVGPSPTRKIFYEGWRASEESLAAISEAISANEKHAANIQGLDAILNVNQFLSIFNYDLSVVHYELTAPGVGWRKSFHARVAALLLVEFLEDISQLVGKDWRAAVLPFLTTNESQERLRRICKTVAELSRRHEGNLRKLRNVAIGHREKDAGLQLRAIRAVDPELIIGIVLDVTHWMTTMIRFQTDLMNEITRSIKSRNRPGS